MNSHAKSISSSYNNNNNGNNTCVVHQVIVFFLEAIGLFCSARGTQITNSSRDARACRSARVCVCVCVCAGEQKQEELYSDSLISTSVAHDTHSHTHSDWTESVNSWKCWTLN